MMKEKLNKAKAFAKKYHLDYVAIAAGSVAAGVIMHKLHIDHLNPEDCDAGIGVEPYFIDPETPGVRFNVFNILKDGSRVMTERLIFDKDDYQHLNKLALECLEEALKVKAENE